MKTILNPRIVLKEHLNDEDYAAIKALEQECCLVDRTALKLELDYKLQVARTDIKEDHIRFIDEFMYFSDARLIGYIGIGSFGGPGAALEITGMVHPEYRRRGVFSLLHALVVAECKRRNAKEILLLCDRESASGQTFLRRIEAEYKYSEYEMYLRGEFPIIREEQLCGIALRKATNADAHEIARQNAIYFGEEEEPFVNAENQEDGQCAPNKSLLLPEDEEKRGMIIYLAQRQGEIVGKVHAESNSGDVGGIYGLGVLPAFRKNGFGRAILLSAIQKLQETGARAVLLQVAADNATALGLYESCGFRKTSTMDYFHLAG
jgi:ribosomal protein S18 acetylase RimI-like enzyme